MSRKQFFLLAIMMVVASFLGGAVASRLFTPGEAWAQGGQKVIQADEVRAKRVIIEDEQGKERIGLYMFEENPHLIIYDESRRKRVALGTLMRGSTLTLFDEEGNTGVMLDCHRGGSSLFLSDCAENHSADLHAFKNGSALCFKGENGKKIWSAP